MNLTLVSAEVNPFSKVGGMGDVLGALPPVFVKKGLKLKIITPAYKSVFKTGNKLIKLDDSFDVNIGNNVYDINVYKCENKKTCPDIYFIGTEALFQSRNVYVDDLNNPYSDNVERFLLFQKATIEFLIRNNFKSDIIHCHDNQTAMIPVYLKTVFKDHEFFKNTKTILTLHNVAYQGKCSMEKKELFELPDNLFYAGEPMEYFGDINPLKGGIVLSDKLLTVSPGHAGEINYNEVLSAGMKDVVMNRKDRIVGIINGLDIDEWNPETDKFIFQNYSQDVLDKKYINKKELVKECGFSKKRKDLPLYGMVTRLVEQKGIDLLLESMDQLLKRNINLVILGSGEEKYHIDLKKYFDKYRDRLFIDFNYNVALGHKIIAGCDCFLMPSRYEPCGITQLQSMRYGTIPVAHLTGGLGDTITPSTKKHGTGFLFVDYTVDAMLESVDLSLEYYKKKKEWKNLMLNGMKKDFSWENSADQYIKLYKAMLD